MALVAGYGSDTDASEGSGNEPIAQREREDIQSDGSDSNSSCSESDDGEDGGTDAHRDEEEPEASGLPSALDAWEDVEGRPAFLDPEATRQLAAHPTHGVAEAASEQEAEDAAGAASGRQKPSADFDISKLAPPLKGQKRQGAVIEGKAKRYRPEEGPEAQQQYTAAQIAMLGGQVREADATESAPGEQPGSSSAPRGKASKAMPVSEFLDKGISGAALPRRKQDRKDKEKSKRALGQSSVHGWKTEAEMVLRQQYDS